MDLEVILKRFAQPDEVREFEKGRFEIVHIGGMTIGRATYQPDGNGRSTSASRWASASARSSMSA